MCRRSGPAAGLIWRLATQLHRLAPAPASPPPPRATTRQEPTDPRGIPALFVQAVAESATTDSTSTMPTHQAHSRVYASRPSPRLARTGPARGARRRSRPDGASRAAATRWRQPEHERLLDEARSEFSRPATPSRACELVPPPATRLASESEDVKFELARCLAAEWRHGQGLLRRRTSKVAAVGAVHAAAEAEQRSKRIP